MVKSFLFQVSKWNLFYIFNKSEKTKQWFTLCQNYNAVLTQSTYLMLITVCCRFADNKKIKLSAVIWYLIKNLLKIWIKKK